LARSLFACLRKLLIEFSAMRRASSRMILFVAERRHGLRGGLA
jgi:hypothetical protein